MLQPSGTFTALYNEREGAWTFYTMRGPLLPELAAATLALRVSPESVEILKNRHGYFPRIQFDLVADPSHGELLLGPCPACDLHGSACTLDRGHGGSHRSAYGSFN